MKKEYISPEVEIIEVGLHGTLMSPSTDIPEGEDDEELGSRDDYNDNTPTRPGSGNVWNQGW